MTNETTIRIEDIDLHADVAPLILTGSGQKTINLNGWAEFTVALNDAGSEVETEPWLTACDFEFGIVGHDEPLLVTTDEQKAMLWLSLFNGAMSRLVEQACERSLGI